VNPDEPMLREARAPKAAKVEAEVVPAEAEAVAEEMIAAAEPAEAVEAVETEEAAV
jgi:small subunit ribosomal protein S2